MTSHSRRATRLDDATEIANTVAGLRAPYKSMTLITGDIAHNADIIARVNAAVEVMETAGVQYTSRNGNLSAPAYLRFAERRDVLRQMRADIVALVVKMA